MNTTLYQSKHQRPFVAGFRLMAAIPISALIGLPLLWLLSIDLGDDRWKFIGNRTRPA